MRYLIDTADIPKIRRYTEYLPIAGVTSNPTIVKKEGRIDFFSHMKEIRTIIGDDAQLHIQVSQKDVNGMMADAKAILDNVDNRVYIKVPVTMEGIKTIKALKKAGVNVTATAVYSQAQAFMALEAGADCIAPYFNRMEAMGIDAAEVIANIAHIIDRNNYPTQILAASFKNVAQIDRAILAGAQEITSDPDVFETALSVQTVSDAVDVFCGDWHEVFGEATIAEL